MKAKTNTLRLEEATPEDVPALTETWFAAFADDAVIRRLWPDTPSVRAWWDTANRGDMWEKPFQRFIKVVDTSTGDIKAATDGRGGKAGRPRIAAWAKWDTNLDTLVTHPDYQRRGAASMLLRWGCELADENGVGAYVDASKAGALLYERFGFVDESVDRDGEVASMARRRRS
ncbi:acetyltransferase [Colletotrichum orchidophilum]|uniref:Acetyltransferase n=1 Tax=Colletotrichum orchidophilum TaxID=1209926 RepID=A0A1G4B3X6_9PEZI|nr:acetyltransferase [Colletotrichum orchidophilum]OHE96130.1 acetyltransferase [Colletotrichum orchidophilum]